MEDSVISPNDIWEIVKYRKWSLIIPVCLIVIISGTIALVLPSHYKSTATILIEEQEIPPDFVMATVTSYIEKRLQTINQRIMSTATLLDIIKRFNLYADMKEKYTIEEIVEEMRNDIQMQPIDADVIDRRTGRPTTATIAFTLSYQGKEPNTVYQVNNVLTSLYLEENLKIRERQAKETSSFLEEELRKVKEDLDASDSKITELKETHINELPELMQINLQGLSNAERTIDRLNDQLGSLKEREIYLQTQIAAMTSDEEDLNQKRLDERKLMLIQLRTEFSEYYPDVVKVKKEIKALEKQMQASGLQENQKSGQSDNAAYITLSSQLENIRSEMELIHKNISGLESEKLEYQHRLEVSPKVEAEYNTLLMEKRNTQIKYDDLTRKHMEAKIAQGLEKDQKGERFTLIDPPMVPEKPFKPNRLVIFLIGLVLSFGAGIGVLTLEEMTDHSIRKPEMLAFITGHPVLISVPEIITLQDLKIRKRRNIIWIISIVSIVIIGILIFHFFVMDLNVFWAKLMRKVAR
ncbi:MAG: chain-length determining protein [Proteobacteria bacterium]|nr:chain-length determining protein [Pseudomonadota bacterium]